MVGVIVALSVAAKVSVAIGYMLSRGLAKSGSSHISDDDR